MNISPGLDVTELPKEDDDPPSLSRFQWPAKVNWGSSNPLKYLFSGCIYLYRQSHGKRLTRRSLALGGDLLWETDPPYGQQTYFIIATVDTRPAAVRDRIEQSLPEASTYRIEGYAEDVEELNEQSLRFSAVISIAIKH